MPLRTRQQGHAPTHQPIGMPSTTTYFLTVNLTHDDQYKPLPAPDIFGDFQGPLTLPLRLRSRPHLHFAPRPTRRRQFER